LKSNYFLEKWGCKMDRHILRIYQIVQSLLTNFPVNQNSIEMRVGPLLHEMNWTAKQILSLLQKQPLNKNLLKIFLSILFRDDEAADPLFHAWVRASTWTESADPKEIKRRKDLYKMVKVELEHLTPYIQSIYGKDQARYIIPPLMREEKV
jgi:hypothetical protein